MNGERSYLKNNKPYSNNYVNFGDDAKWKIIGEGKCD